MSPQVVLRSVIEQDLPELYEQQLHAAAVPEELGAFYARWSKNRSDPQLRVRSIVVGELLVGYIAQFHRRDQPEVSYCLGKQYWGRGFATEALRQFLGEIELRPLYARAAKGNIRSVRVLEKCGFAIVAEDRFTDARGRLVEEFLFAFTAPWPGP